MKVIGSLSPYGLDAQPGGSVAGHGCPSCAGGEQGRDLDGGLRAELDGAADDAKPSRIVVAAEQQPARPPWAADEPSDDRVRAGPPFELLWGWIECRALSCWCGVHVGVRQLL